MRCTVWTFSPNALAMYETCCRGQTGSKRGEIVTSRPRNYLTDRPQAPPPDSAPHLICRRVVRSCVLNFYCCLMLCNLNTHDSVCRRLTLGVRLLSSDLRMHFEQQVRNQGQAGLPRRKGFKANAWRGIHGWPFKNLTILLKSEHWS